jgi:tetratricopeptide (TPR) repeat protein
MPARIQRIEDLDRIPVAGVNWRPLRRTLGITAFGTNAYTADAGEEVVEAHTEGSGHEEMYVVIAGAARFEVAGETLDAGAGTVVFLPEGEDHRRAVATEDGTTVLAVGGMPGTIAPSAWEWRFAAAPARDAGDYDRAYEICAEGLAVHPDEANLQFDLACFAALGGHRERAIEHLRKAIELNPRAREWMATDDDLVSIRDEMG